MRKIVLFLMGLMLAVTARAAQQFVTFSSQPDAISLAGATIGYSTQEYEGVKIAISNLQTDIERVMGKAPLLLEGSTLT